MINITLVAVGKIKEAFLNKAAVSYSQRIKPYGRLKIEEIKAESFLATTKAKAKKIEGERLQTILNRKNAADIYLLSERGERFDSQKFAAKIDTKRELVLVIAGSLGFTEDLENKYSKISLSPLTFPHELARVILLEQIYRATTILNNKEYHY